MIDKKREIHAETLGADELAILKKVRAFMEPKSNKRIGEMT